MILSYKSGEFEETLAWSTALIYSFVIFLYDIRNIIDNKKKEYPDDIIDNEDSRASYCVVNSKFFP